MQAGLRRRLARARATMPPCSRCAGAPTTQCAAGVGRCRCCDPAAAATRRRCHLPPPLPTPQLPPHPYSQLALAVGSELRKKKRAASQAVKKDISKGAAPLKASPAPSASRQGNKTFRQAWRKTAGDLSEEEQRTAVLQVCPPGLGGGDDRTCCRVPCCVLWAAMRCRVCRDLHRPHSLPAASCLGVRSPGAGGVPPAAACLIVRPAPHTGAGEGTGPAGQGGQVRLPSWPAAGCWPPQCTAKQCWRSRVYDTSLKPVLLPSLASQSALV